MNSFKDERITSQTHKIGNESFFILIAMLMISIIYKSMAKGVSFQSFQTEWILIMLSCCYYTIRCIIAGVYVMPSGRKGRSKFTKSILLWISLGALAWGLFISVINMFLYQGGVFSWLTLSIFLISSAVFFILLITAFIGIYALSGLKTRKSSEE